MNQDILLYEGQEPYIFVSYCHKDKESVIPVIQRIIGKGYRIWFDRGIHPGSEWPEIVAEHLDKCAVFMIFISDNYMQSQNCIREIHFAVARNKKLISVMMEEVKLTPGVEMQLCVSQALRYDEYPDKDRFFADLYRAEALEVCKGQAQFSGEKKHGREEKKSEPGRTGEARKRKSQNRGNVPPRRRALKIVRMTVAIVIAAIVAGLAGSAVWHTRNTVEIGGQKYTKKDSNVQIRDVNVDAELINELQEFRELSSLTFENCTFEESGLESLKTIETVTTLNLAGCSGVTDCGFVNGMPELSILKITDCSLTDESIRSIEPSDTLRYLTLSGNPGLTDTDWAEGFPELTVLELDDNGIEDASGAAGLENLRTLSLENNQLTCMSEPLRSLRLESLNLSGNRITDLSGLSDLTILTGFYMGDNGYAAENGSENPIPVCVNASSAVLKEVDLSGNGFSREDILNMLQNCSQLTYLDVSDNPDLGTLDVMASGELLETLNAKNCGLTGLEGIEFSTALAEIDLSGNMLETLEGFPQLATELGVYLNLSENRLSSLGGLNAEVSYDTLLLYGNPFAGNPPGGELEALQGNILGLTYIEGMSPETLMNFSNCYVENLPDNQRVAWEDTLGFSRLNTERYEPEQ